jgi:23S rRNA (adenine2503-C2)-methyltransferase
MPDSGEKTKKRLSLYDLTPAELESFFLSIGEKRYRARQVMDFLYRHPADSFDAMTTLPADLRRRLGEPARLAPLVLRATVEAPDGAIKHGYEIEGPVGGKILLESVWMRSEPADGGPSAERGEGKAQAGRYTLCISSQLGCAAGCTFCATGKLGLRAQLTTGEIVYQVVHTLVMYGRLPDTVLFMGMGEPMHNFDAVAAAVDILTHPRALGFSPRRIVVSTAGELERLGAWRRRFPKVRLAISLNAATNDVRNSLMPVNNRFDLRAIAAFISSIELSRGERVTLEYVVLSGINDNAGQVDALLAFLKPIAGRVKVNLIPFNPVKGIGFRSPERGRVLEIQEALRKIGVMAFVRRNRGRGVSAACGQLGGG